MTAEEKAALEQKEKEQKEPVTFSDAQQQKLQEIIDSRMGKVKGQHEKELKDRDDKLAALEAELAELKAGKSGNGEEDDKTRKEEIKQLIKAEKDKAAKADQLRQQAEGKTKSTEQELLNLRKETAMQRAMSKFNFVDQEAVMALTAKNVAWSDDAKAFVILGADGQPRQNSALDNLTLDEYMAETAAKRPYLVNGDMVPGAGSTEGTKSNITGVVKSKADLKDRKARMEYIDKFGLEAYEKLPR